MSYAKMLEQAKEITKGYVGKIAIAYEMEYLVEPGTTEEEYEQLCDNAYENWRNSDCMTYHEAVEQEIVAYMEREQE